MKTKWCRAICALLILLGLVSCTGKASSGSSAGGMTGMQKNMQEMHFTGYLVDQACGSVNKDPANNNLSLNPEKHAVACALVCKASGYGMYMKDGTNMNYTYYKFDKEGSDKAFTILNKTSLKSGVMIAVDGMLMSNTIYVSNITETMKKSM